MEQSIAHTLEKKRLMHCFSWGLLAMAYWARTKGRQRWRQQENRWPTPPPQTHTIFHLAWIQACMMLVMSQPHRWGNSSGCAFLCITKAIVRETLTTKKKPHCLDWYFLLYIISNLNKIILVHRAKTWMSTWIHIFAWLQEGCPYRQNAASNHSFISETYVWLFASSLSNQWCYV